MATLETALQTLIGLLTEDTSPDGAADYLLTLDASASELKKVLLDNLPGGGGIPVSGWITLGQTLTYASADDPTYTVTCAGVDLTSVLSVGMRLRVSQSTGGTKYFIITKLVFSTDTTVTLYGGTDYDLANEAISSPYYSPVKAPLGFPLDSPKWTVEVTDTTDRSQASPVSGTWYNIGAIAISIPIGIWRTWYRVTVQPNRSATGDLRVSTTLSTANNSESDVDLSADHRASSESYFNVTLSTEKVLSLTAKTPYYLNTKITGTSLAASYTANAVNKLIIRAVCAYL